MPVVGVLVVVGAGVLHDHPVCRCQRMRPPHGPRLRVELRIVDGLLVRKFRGTDAPPALGHVQRVAVAVAMVVQPRAIGEVHRIDDQRIAVPLPYRVAHERRLPVLAVGPTVRVDHPEVVHVLVEEDHLVRQLHDLERVGRGVHTGHAGKLAVARRVNVVPPTCPQMERSSRITEAEETRCKRIRMGKMKRVKKIQIKQDLCHSWANTKQVTNQGV